MKKLLLKIAIIGSLFISMPGFSQSSACGYTTCVPALKFSNPDMLQLYGAILGSYSVAPTGTTVIADYSNDSITRKLFRLINVSYRIKDSTDAIARRMGYLFNATYGSVAAELALIYPTVYASDNKLGDIYFNGVIGLSTYNKYINGKLDSSNVKLGTLSTYNKYINGKIDSSLVKLNTLANYGKYTNGKLDSLDLNDEISGGKLDLIKQKLDTVNQSIRYNNSLLRYNTNKQDSMIAAQSYTVLTFTITCANTGTAVTANQTMGTAGVYSITVPTGNWQIVSSVITHSLQSASSIFRMFVFSGSQNIAAFAEGATFNITANQATELTTVYNTATTLYTSLGIGGSTGAFSTFCLPGNISLLSDGRVYPSGTLKLAFVQGAAYTPPANAVYFVRVRMKRVS